MYKRLQKNFAVILLLILTLGGNVVFVEVSHSNVSALDDSKTLITCSPLYINGNDNFALHATTEGWQGDGSEANPYIIENYDININGNKSDGIKISNTDVYFIIRSCKIYGCGNWYASIRLSNVTNGKIEKIDSYNNFYGFVLVSSSKNIFENCSLHDNSIGIKLEYSSENNIKNSYVCKNDNYGISLYWSSNNIISGCNIYDIEHNGISLFSSSNNIITATVIYNSDRGVNIESSSNNTVTQCILHDNKWGVTFTGSSDSSVLMCAIYNNNYGGIGFFSSSNNVVHYCNIYNNQYGIDNTAAQTEQYTVNATYNWWGSPDGPSGVAHGKGDKVTAYVIYDPWLREPVNIPGAWLPSKEADFKSFYFYAIVSIVCSIVVIISIAILRKKKSKKLIQQPERKSLEGKPPITAQCPHCQTTFQITLTKKPFKVKCPECGKKSMLR